MRQRATLPGSLTSGRCGDECTAGGAQCSGTNSLARATCTVTSSRTLSLIIVVHKDALPSPCRGVRGIEY